jgi:4-hydroxythreonine-4-phosphate dehydrogenase
MLKNNVMKPLVMTMGDPAGIGPEIIVDVFMKAPQHLYGCLVLGDRQYIHRAIQILGARHIHLLCYESFSDYLQDYLQNQLPVDALPVLQVNKPLAKTVNFGVMSKEGGQMAAECVTWAAHLALKRQVEGIVTAPLHKEALHLAGYTSPGHTELLQVLTVEYLGCRLSDVPVRMMLNNTDLYVVLVSAHLSLRKAIEAVSKERVLETIVITHQALAHRLKRQPTIAVAGLNPHAGEGGAFGREEIEHISPAIKEAKEQGYLVSGPYSPDTIFMHAKRSNRLGQEQALQFDVVIAMYHDQGLIPIKYEGIENGVNTTLGLPFIRTSPDHGTAFGIAGKGIANSDSLLEAIKTARRLSQNIT